MPAELRYRVSDKRSYRFVEARRLRAKNSSFARGRPHSQEAPPEPLAPGLLARLAAAQAISETLTLARPLDERIGLLKSQLKYSDLEPRDLALARSIATAALRRLGSIRKALAARLEKGMPKKPGGLEWILITGAAQILFLDLPDHAAVDLAIRAIKLDPLALPYAALGNAVLRAVAQAKTEILQSSDALNDDTPAWLAARWRNHFGEAALRSLALAHRNEPTLDISVRSNPQEWARRLNGVLLPTGSIRLDSHDAIPELPGYSEGEWWVQDVAAALPARLLRPAPGMRIVDLCAAPGGKSIEIANAGANLTAVDRSAERLKRLAANFERMHLSANIVVSDALTFDAAPFDAVLLDAPCASTGTIRRHPDVAWTKKVGDIAGLARMQAQLLDKACALTKPGGILVYCTCSLEPEEGEAQIAALLRRNPDLRRAPVGADEIGGLEECLSPAGDLRTMPFHFARATPRQSGMDGFYAARLSKKA